MSLFYPSNLLLAKTKLAGLVAWYVDQNGSAVLFEVLQSTTPLQQYLNVCDNLLGITITSTSGQSKFYTSEQEFNMRTCDFENGLALINLDVELFPGPKTGENYTVFFNITFHFDGVVDLCYLQLEVDNITVSDQGELKVLTPANHTPGYSCSHS